MGIKSKETAKKYHGKLQTLLTAVSSTTFSMGDFLKEHGLNKKFIYACEEIGYIKQVGKQGLRIVYKANFTPDQVKEETGEIIRKRIAELSRQERVRAANNRTKKEKVKTEPKTIPHLHWEELKNTGEGKELVTTRKDEQEKGLRTKIREFIEQEFEKVGHKPEPVKVQPLSERTSSALIAELQRRDFEGTLTRLKTENGVSLMEEYNINIKKEK